MRNKKVLSLLLIFSMMFSLLPQVFAGVVDEPVYGDKDLFTDGGFEMRVGDIWRPYYSWNTAYWSYVTNDTHPDYIKSGTGAMRFTNVGGSTFRGPYFYNGGNSWNTMPDKATGTKYLFSGWFTTDADSAVIQILAPDGSGANIWGEIPNADGTVTTIESTSGKITLEKDKWINIKFYWTIGDTKSESLRFNTNLTTSIKGSDYGGDVTKLGAALDANGQKYVYVDDVSMRVIKETWAENAVLETSSGTSNGLARASYEYYGTLEEGASYVQYQINNTDSETGWVDYKKVENINESNPDDTMILLDSECNDKYIRAQIVPVNINGERGNVLTTDSVKLGTVVNIIKNAAFDWVLIDSWSGDISLADGEAVISGTALYDTEYALTGDSKMSFSFDAKGSGTMEVFLNDISCGTVDLTSEMTPYKLSVALEAADNIEVKIVAEDATIDNVLLAPQAPSVYGVKILGTPASNSTLSVSYVYDNSTDDGIKEGDTVIEWYVDGSKVAVGKKYTLPNTSGGEVYVAVTPVNANGVAGTKVMTDPIEFYKAEVSDLYITTNDGYKTNSILIPHYKYVGTELEENSKLEWVMSDSPEAPINEWEPVPIYNRGASYRPQPATTVSSATVVTDGYLPLNQETVDKYVAFKITPVDSKGREGEPRLSEATPVIEFERNLVSNSTFSEDNQMKGGWKVGGTGYVVNGDNSTVPDEDDGTGSISLDGSNRKAGWETHPGQTTFHGGDNVMTYRANYATRAGITYVLTADARLNYDFDVTMPLHIMYVTGDGYGGSINHVSSTDWSRMKATFTGKEGSGSSLYFAFRSGGLKDDSRIVKAGKFSVDNVEVYEQAPYATDVKVKGSAEVGNTLVASYTFTNTADIAEGKSAQEWLVADNAWGPWSVYKTQNATNAGDITLDITEDLSGKYIKFRVTPKDMVDTYGIARSSTNEIFVAPVDDIDYDITETEGTYNATASFKNVQGAERTITALLVGYKAQEGSEAVVDIAMDSHEVGAGETCEDFSVSVSDPSIEYVKLYFLEGESFDRIRPVDGQVSTHSKAEALSKSSVVINQETKEATFGLISENPSQLAFIYALNSGASASGINADNIKDSILYASMVRTGINNGVAADFVLSTAEEGKTYTANASFKDGVKVNLPFKYEGMTAAQAIIDAIKAATPDAVEDYLTGTLIGGYDIRDVLFIDTTDFENVEDKSKITSLIAGKDFTGKTADIKTIVENESKKQYVYEVWTDNMTAFTEAINTCDASELSGIMYEYNFLFDFDLDNEYGFSLKLNKQNKEAFYTEILADLKECIGATHEKTESNIKSDFDKIIALAAVNNGAWDKMDEILDEHWNTIGLGDYEGYEKANKTDMFKDIYDQTFADLDTAQEYIEDAIEELLSKKPAKKPEGGGGGGGGGAVTTPESTLTDRPVAIIDTNKVDTDETSGDAQDWSFADLDGTHWAHEAIVKCAEKGILRGYDDNTYMPDNLVTRAEFASILIRIAGITVEDEYDDVFTDVTENDWYFANVYAAKEAGIINGTSNTEFSPNAYITREEMATMVYRLCKSKITKTTDITFTDFDTISDWAASAVTSLAEAEIVNGTGDELFEPKASVTRAMSAQIASRLIEVY